jgi:hypothetical protein
VGNAVGTRAHDVSAIYNINGLAGVLAEAHSGRGWRNGIWIPSHGLREAPWSAFRLDRIGGEDVAHLDTLGDQRLDVRLGLGDLGECFRLNVSSERKHCWVDALEDVNATIGGTLHHVRQALGQPPVEPALVAAIPENLLSGRQLPACLRGETEFCPNSVFSGRPPHSGSISSINSPARIAARQRVLEQRVVGTVDNACSRIGPAITIV